MNITREMFIFFWHFDALNVPPWEYAQLLLHYRIRFKIPTIQKYKFVKLNGKVTNLLDFTQGTF